MSKLVTVERARHMILGSFLADAATMGLHWVYSQKEISDLILASNQSGAFFNPPISKYYSYEHGLLSPYGDENFPLLETLAASTSNSDQFDSETFAAVTYSFFSDYKGRKNHPIKAFVENRSAGKPFAQCAAVDHQAQGIIKMPLIVAKYGGRGSGDEDDNIGDHTRLLTAAEKSVRVLQDSDESVAASQLLALVLEHVLETGCSPEEAVRWLGDHKGGIVPETMKNHLSFVLDDALVLEWTRFRRVLCEQHPQQGAALCAKVFPLVLTSNAVETAIRSLETEDEGENFSQEDREALSAALVMAAGTEVPTDGYTLPDRLEGMGLSCALPSCLLGCLYIALHTDSYRSAIVENILCGGDNCSRSIVLGGLFGAYDWPSHASTGAGTGTGTSSSSSGDTTDRDNNSSSVPTEWLEAVNPVVWAKVEKLTAQVVQSR